MVVYDVRMVRPVSGQAVPTMNVGKAITLGMQDQKRKDENKFVYWNLAYWQERMIRALIKLDRQERERHG